MRGIGILHTLALSSVWAGWLTMLAADFRRYYQRGELIHKFYHIIRSPFQAAVFILIFTCWADPSVPWLAKWLIFSWLIVLWDGHGRCNHDDWWKKKRRQVTSRIKQLTSGKLVPVPEGTS